MRRVHESDSVSLGNSRGRREASPLGTECPASGHQKGGLGAGGSGTSRGIQKMGAKVVA